MRFIPGGTRWLSASFEVARWAESETTRILRLSGKTRRAERRFGANRFFDKDQKSQKATPDEVKILLNNGLDLSVREVLELYSLRWQIELFFKELKIALGFSQYSFKRFKAVEGWVKTLITAVLYMEYERICRIQDRRLSEDRRKWWERQRLHGLCLGIKQELETTQLQYVEKN